MYCSTSYIHAVKLPLDISLIRETSSSSCTALHNNRDCLTPQQMDFIYKKVELGGFVNKSTIKEELDTDIELDKMDDNSGDENPYKELIVNNACKIENMLSQMVKVKVLLFI